MGLREPCFGPSVLCQFLCATLREAEPWPLPVGHFNGLYMLTVTLCMPQAAMLWPLPAEPLFCVLCCGKLSLRLLPSGFFITGNASTKVYINVFLMPQGAALRPLSAEPFVYHAAGSWASASFCWGFIPFLSKLAPGELSLGLSSPNPRFLIFSSPSLPSLFPDPDNLSFHPSRQPRLALTKRANAVSASLIAAAFLPLEIICILAGATKASTF